MKKIAQMMVTIIMFVAATTVVTWAGSVTIPNSFTAGEAAVAAEVNANFTAVKTAVNDNDSRISTNASDISSNTSDIATNASNISSNTSDIATNASNISSNTSDIATNASNIANNTSNVTVFDLQNWNASETIPQNSSVTYLRDVGTFTKNSASSKILLYYQDKLEASSSGTICAMMVKIDAKPSGIHQPFIYNETTNANFTMSMGVIEGLSAGSHTVEMYYRNLYGTCVRNSGNWNGRITVVEVP